MGTHHEGSAEEVRALNAYIALVRSSESVTARTSGPMADHDLTVSQFGALEALHHLGPLCQRDLAEKLLRTGGNMTMVVDNLEKRGLVVRKRGKDDRRFVAVHLSGEGRALVRKVFPKVLASIVRELGALTAREQEELRRLCRKLGLRGS
ncbi:MarR family transcriptional regulator [bacterium]|nr:MarR family transcriptional regulator [bacterium]